MRTNSIVKKRKTAPKKRANVTHAVLNALDPADHGGEVVAREGVQSIARAFDIMEAIAKDRQGINLSELSRRVGLHNSTTFHLVRTMVSLGYIRQDPQSKRYRIGRPLFALASRAFDEVEMVALATPILERLSMKTGESAHFSVRSARSTVILARTSGVGPFQISENPGTVRPANCTALGKVLLAAMPIDMFEQYLAHGELVRRTDKSISDAEPLRREIAEVRTRGVSFDDGELDPELRCIAAPVRNFTGQIVGAIGISAPIWRMPVQKMVTSADIIREFAAILSTEFGYDDIVQSPHVNAANHA